MTNNMKTFFRNCFQRIPVSLDAWLPVFNGLLEHFALKGFYYIVKIAKEFYCSASPAHLKNAFNQIHELMVNEAFDYSQFWREIEEFPFRQIITAQQNSCWSGLPIALQNAKEQRRVLSENIGVQIIFNDPSIQKRFQSTNNHKQY